MFSSPTPHTSSPSSYPPNFHVLSFWAMFRVWKTREYSVLNGNLSYPSTQYSEIYAEEEAERM